MKAKFCVKNRKNLIFNRISDVNYNFEMEDESDNTDDEMGSDKLNHAFLNFLTIDSNDEDKSDSEESSKYEDDDEGL